jgi:excisionase family DNA binding protein
MMLRSYGVQEAAEFLRLSKDTVCRRARNGELEGYKPGRRWVFLEEDLIAYLKSTQPPISPLLAMRIRPKITNTSLKPSAAEKRIAEELLRLRLEKKRGY